MKQGSVPFFAVLLLLCVGCVPPTFNPEQGTYSGAQSVSIVAASSMDTVYYTIDGSDPTTSSSVFSAPLYVDENTTIKAMAVRFGMPSDVAQAGYVILPPNNPPVANAGGDLDVHTGDSVSLSGSATDDDGEPLNYSWTLDRPDGSAAELSGATTLNPSFTADKTGTYVATLVVTDGQDTDTDTVTVTAQNAAPTADAGGDTSVHVGTNVQLDGYGLDPDGDTLVYTWSFIEQPIGSTVMLADVTKPVFTPDKIGTYEAELIVSDGEFASIDTVTVTAVNTAPMANAGAEQSGIFACTQVTLDGSASSDADGDTLKTYQWTITTPDSQTFTLFGMQPMFTADRVGTYTLTLVVNDGFEDSGSSQSFLTTVEPVIVQDFENELEEWTVEEVENAPSYEVSSYEISTGSGQSFKVGKGTNHFSYGKLTLIKRFDTPTYVESISAEVIKLFGSTLGTGYLRIDGTQEGGDDLATGLDQSETREWTIEREVSQIAFRYYSISPYDQLYIDNITINFGCDTGSLPTTDWYPDNDGDGYGDNSIAPTTGTTQPAGHVHDNTDCDDGDSYVHPGAYDIPENSIDEDCDGEDASNQLTWYYDSDGDGFGDPDDSMLSETQPDYYVINNMDCDDSEAGINPNAPEVKDNDVDENCDGVKEMTPTWYHDGDGDGYGDPDDSRQEDTAPAGYIADNTDCDDGDPLVNPGAEDIMYNGVDDNCDGDVDENDIPRNILMLEDWVALETSIRTQMMCQHNGCGEPGGAIDWTSNAPNGGNCRWHVFVSGFAGDSTFYYNDWNEDVGGSNMAVSGSVHGVFGLDKSSWTDGTLNISGKWNGTIVDDIYVDGGVKHHGDYTVTCSDTGCADGPLTYAPILEGGVCVGWQLME